MLVNGVTINVGAARSAFVRRQSLSTTASPVCAAKRSRLTGAYGLDRPTSATRSRRTTTRSSGEPRRSSPPTGSRFTSFCRAWRARLRIIHKNGSLRPFKSKPIRPTLQFLICRGILNEDQRRLILRREVVEGPRGREGNSPLWRRSLLMRPALLRNRHRLHRLCN
jgi:hypothetical protein